VSVSEAPLVYLVETKIAIVLNQMSYFASQNTKIVEAAWTFFEDDLLQQQGVLRISLIPFMPTF
jgi:hypothetical protein